MRIDTAQKADKINFLSKIIIENEQNEAQYESIVKIKDNQIKDYQNTYNSLSKACNKQAKKLTFYKRTTGIFGSLTLILTGLIFVIAK